MFGSLFSIFAPLLTAMYAKKNMKTAVPMTTPSVISPQVTETLGASRKRYKRLGGRQSTIMTGGLFSNPNLLRQGLTV